MLTPWIRGCTSGSVTLMALLLGSNGFLDDWVLQHPEVADFDPHGLARAEIAGRLPPVSGAGRRPRRDDVAGLERHDPREVAHDLRDPEDHPRSTPVLQALAVDPEPDREVMRLRDLVASDERRAHR